MRNLQTMRNKKGLSQRQLAELAGIPVQTLQRYEIGYRRIESAHLATICNLCRALSCQISDIIDDEELKKMYEETK